MLDGDSHLAELKQRLAAVMASFESSKGPMGRPEFVQKAAQESEKIFQGYAKARPSKEDAYAAALAFMRGQQLDDRQQDLVAAALSEPVREFGGARPLGHEALPTLLETYSRQAKAGHLWRLTWFGLLCSYFAFDPLAASKKELDGWDLLQAVLERTQSHVCAPKTSGALPDWVAALNDHPNLLRRDAADRYALDYVAGRDEDLRRLSTDLSIPEGSWFWHALVLSAVRRSAEQPDEQFKAAIPKLLELVKARPVFRDESLEIILTRYHRCAQAPVHEQLRNFVVNKEVWRNPKLRAAGIATAWNRVSDPVWQMVLNWVNERNLKAFFEILATRNSSDEGRLAFWSRYLKQISWTRLIFSSETTALARSSPEIRELLAGEEGAYATLWGNKSLDAFMMQIGNYLIVEFSAKGNAAYIYPSSSLKFDRHAAQYHGGTEDLRYGFRDSSARRIVHNHSWQVDATHTLKHLGIHPDELDNSVQMVPTAEPSTAPAAPATPAQPSQSEPRATTPRLFQPGGTIERPPTGATPLDAPPGASFSMSQLVAVLNDFEGAYVDDRRAREGSSGRLWIEDPRQSVMLGGLLRRWGFRWSNKRCAFYYPET